MGFYKEFFEFSVSMATLFHFKVSVGPFLRADPDLDFHSTCFPQLLSNSTRSRSRPRTPVHTERRWR